MPPRPCKQLRGSDRVPPTVRGWPHAANRLQAALYKEVLYLVQQGVLSIADADIGVSYGPGLRWGVMGPSLQWHIAGGEGGIDHFVEHLLDPLVELMRT